MPNTYEKISMYMIFLHPKFDMSNYSEDQLTEICEDAFVNVKEACMRLQEKTKCSNEVVVKMLNSVAEFYLSQNEGKHIRN